MTEKNTLKRRAIAFSIAISLLLGLVACGSTLSQQNNGEAGSEASASPAASSAPTETPSIDLSSVLEKLDITATHPTLDTKQGNPALLNVGEVFPEFSVIPYIDGELKGELKKGNEVVTSIAPKNVKAGETIQVSTGGKTVSAPGLYTLTVQLTVGGKTFYDSAYFMAVEPNTIPEGNSKLAYLGKDGKLVYVPDFYGNTIMDYSYAGYMGGGVKIPDVPVVEVVEPGEGDDTKLIQDAIRKVAQMQPDANGFRGAILLKKGRYEISGSLTIGQSGIVLRGEGNGDDGTVLVATGTSKRALIQVSGSSGAKAVGVMGVNITDQYVPVGARSFHIEQPEKFKVGDKIIVRRVGNRAWISEMGMDKITVRESGTEQWSPFVLEAERTITAIDGDLITIDAPIPCAIESKWGGGSIIKYTDDYRVENVGIENMKAISEFNPSVTMTYSGKSYYADEKHADTFVKFSNAKNCWARDLAGQYFTFALVDMAGGTKWITVQDCKANDFVSEITGSRRYAYNMSGQLLFVQRCYADTARHAFILQAHLSGPNVFLNCSSTTDYNTSEPHQRWSTGGLFDRVKSQLQIVDRFNYGTGHGWAGANYVAWNCEGSLAIQKPPTAQNYAIGFVGQQKTPPFTPREEGYWESLGKHVEPESLYLQQLKDRLGEEAVKNIGY